MGELENIEKTVAMDEKLLVLDAMTGQEAVNIATQFSEKVGFDGRRADQDGRRCPGVAPP